MQVYLFKKLQAVRVIIVGEEHHSGVGGCAVRAEPRQRGVPLLGGARHAGAFIAARSEHVQVRVRDAAARQEARHELGAACGVLHYDPVEVRDLAESVGQSRELGFLHGAAVRGCDGVDERRRRRRGAVERMDSCVPPRRAAQPGQVRVRRVAHGGPLRVDVDHDDDDQHPRKQDEKAAVEDGLHHGKVRTLPKTRDHQSI